LRYDEVNGNLPSDQAVLGLVTHFYRHLSRQSDAGWEDWRRALVKRTQNGVGNRRAGDADRADGGDYGQDADEPEDTAGVAAAVHDLFLFWVSVTAWNACPLR